MIITVAVPSSGHPKIEFVNGLVQVVGAGMVSNVAIIPRLPVHQARQRAVDLVRQTNSTHLLFIDDDIVFTPQDVQALIEADKPIVCGLVNRRSQTKPLPVVFDRNLDGSLAWAEPPKKLAKVAAGTLAFTLISMDIFNAIGSEFRFTAELGEDMDFFKRVTDAGFEVWLEPKAKVGHLMEVAI